MRGLSLEIATDISVDDDEAEEQLGDEIMILEGGVNGLEGLTFGDDLSSVFSKLKKVAKGAAMVTAPGAAYYGGRALIKAAKRKGTSSKPVMSQSRGGWMKQAMAQAKKPVVDARKGRAITAASIQGTARAVASNLAKRKIAIGRAMQGKQTAIVRVQTLDRQVQSTVKRLAQAQRTRNASAVRPLTAALKQQIKARKVAAGTAIRFAKAQAVAAVALKNADAQQGLLDVAQKLAAQGKVEQTLPVIAAAQQIEDDTKTMRNLREQQVEKWAGQSADADLPPEISGEAPADEGEGSGDEGYPSEEGGGDESGGDEGYQSEEGGGDEMEGLEGKYWDAIKSVGKAVAKPLGKTVKKLTDKALSTAKSMIQKGACKLSKNPAVLKAAASAGAAFAVTVVGGPAAGVVGAKAGAMAGKAAGSTISKLLGKACPGGTKQEAAVPPVVTAQGVLPASTLTTITPVVEAPATAAPAEKKGISPIAIAVPGAAALLYFLLK